VGIQLTDKERRVFEAFMKEKGYEYTEETGNPAYRLFASGG
jgi:threonine dehydratase